MGNGPNNLLSASAGAGLPTMSACPWLPDAMSFTRLALILPLIRCQLTGSPWFAGVLMVIVLSDLLDGPMARRIGTAGSRGACLDAVCDALVVLSGIIAPGLVDTCYLRVAAAMGAAFLSYALFSLVLGRFAYTRLGRYNGVVSYALLAWTGVKPLLRPEDLPVPPSAESVILGLSAAPEKPCATRGPGSPVNSRGGDP